MNATVKPYDVAAIRADFPILARQVYGKPLVYLDNGASAQKPRQVMDAMTRLMCEDYANVHRGLHYLANASTEAYEAARESARRFLNAEAIEEVVFCRSSTGGLNLLASCLGRHLEIGEGDEIILSILEHHSNIVPWHMLAAERGIELRRLLDELAVATEADADQLVAQQGQRVLHLERLDRQVRGVG